MSKHNRHNSNNSDGNSQAAEPTNEQIAALAHSFFEADGQQNGRVLEHWLRAKEQLSKGGQAQPQRDAERERTPRSNDSEEESFSASARSGRMEGRTSYARG